MSSSARGVSSATQKRDPRGLGHPRGPCWNLSSRVAGEAPGLGLRYVGTAGGESREQVAFRSWPGLLACGLRPVRGHVMTPAVLLQPLGDPVRQQGLSV